MTNTQLNASLVSVLWVVLAAGDQHVSGATRFSQEEQLNMDKNVEYKYLIQD